MAGNYFTFSPVAGLIEAIAMHARYIAFRTDEIAATVAGAR
jgi:hypothetical protein